MTLYLVTTLSSSTWVSSPLVAVEVEAKLLRSPTDEDASSDSGTIATGISLAAAQFLTSWGRLSVAAWSLHSCLYLRAGISFSMLVTKVRLWLLSFRVRSISETIWKFLVSY